MKYYINQCTDPRFNLAFEEYLFENATDDIFLLWRNNKSVIIGKNQNAYAEVDLQYAKRNNISVVRRITGGGAVFHDIGNVNYTFISPHLNEQKTFKYFSVPIIEALKSMGVTASFSGRNDLVSSDGRKISGTARCEKNGRVMHHGTLLYCADMTKLKDVLLVNREKIKSKGIKSVSSRVVNIIDLMENKQSVESFMEQVEKFVVKLYNCIPLDITDMQLDSIKKLQKEKYDTDKWNLSSNLPFEKSKTEYFPFGLVSVKHTVKDGKISGICFEGDFFGSEDVAQLEQKMLGIEYSEQCVEEFLNSQNIGRYITGAQTENIISLIFN